MTMTGRNMSFHVHGKGWWFSQPVYFVYLKDRKLRINEKSSRERIKFFFKMFLAMCQLNVILVLSERQLGCSNHWWVTSTIKLVKLRIGTELMSFSILWPISAVPLQFTNAISSLTVCMYFSVPFISLVKRWMMRLNCDRYEWFLFKKRNSEDLKEKISSVFFHLPA